MKIEVIVEGYEDTPPYMPGIAKVYIDGKLYAKLRTEESFTITTTQGFNTQFRDHAGK